MTRGWPVGTRVQCLEDREVGSGRELPWLLSPQGRPPPPAQHPGQAAGRWKPLCDGRARAPPRPRPVSHAGRRGRVTTPAQRPRGPALSGPAADWLRSVGKRAQPRPQRPALHKGAPTFQPPSRATRHLGLGSAPCPPRVKIDPGPRRAHAGEGGWAGRGDAPRQVPALPPRRVAPAQLRAAKATSGRWKWQNPRRALRQAWQGGGIGGVTQAGRSGALVAPASAAPAPAPLALRSAGRAASSAKPPAPPPAAGADGDPGPAEERLAAEPPPAPCGAPLLAVPGPSPRRSRPGGEGFVCHQVVQTVHGRGG